MDENAIEEDLNLLDSQTLEDTNNFSNSNEESETALIHNLKHFVKHLSDAGKFSYLGLCSTVLTLLYFDEFDKEYRHKIVKLLVDHVQLESNPLPTMLALCDGHGLLETDVFVESLMEEKVMKDSPLSIAEDLVLWSLVSSCTKDSAGGRYDARTRILIRHITWRLHIQLESLEGVEERMIKLLQEDNNDEEAKQQAEDRTKNNRRRKWRSYAMIGLAAAGGGAIIGLTGGLAAPLVAAGAGAILGASTAAALGSVAGIAIITSVFGAAGAGLTGYKMKRRVGGIDQFLFRPLTPGKQLAITVAISGWLSSNAGEGDFTVPWISMRQSAEQYCLVWETEHLLRLGGAFEYILDSLISVAANEALKYTILSGLLTAIAWPASLLAASSVIDNPWSVCLQRSIQVGKELAEVLLARQHGHRPVTLIGYSLGARVIYCCLEEMARRKNHSGIVEDVILLGAPVTGEAEQWEKFSKVVAGHITNGYCRSDWLLRFLYRTSSQQTEVAGLQPIKWNDRRMINIDLSSIVEGHMDYRKRMSDILGAVGVRNEADALDVAAQMSSSAKPARSKSCLEVGTVQTGGEKVRSSTAIGIVEIVEQKNNLIEFDEETQNSTTETTHSSLVYEGSENEFIQNDLKETNHDLELSDMQQNFGNEINKQHSLIEFEEQCDSDTLETAANNEEDSINTINIQYEKNLDIDTMPNKVVGADDQTQILELEDTVMENKDNENNEKSSSHSDTDHLKLQNSTGEQTELNSKTEGNYMNLQNLLLPQPQTNEHYDGKEQEKVKNEFTDTNDLSYQSTLNNSQNTEVIYQNLQIKEKDSTPQELENQDFLKENGPTNKTQKAQSEEDCEKDGIQTLNEPIVVFDKNIDLKNVDLEVSIQETAATEDNINMKQCNSLLVVEQSQTVTQNSQQEIKIPITLSQSQEEKYPDITNKVESSKIDPLWQGNDTSKIRCLDSCEEDFPKNQNTDFHDTKEEQQEILQTLPNQGDLQLCDAEITEGEQNNRTMNLFPAKEQDTAHINDTDNNLKSMSSEGRETE